MVGSSNIDPLCMEPAYTDAGECTSEEILRRCCCFAGLNSPGPGPSSGIARRWIFGVFRRSRDLFDGEDGIDLCFKGRCELKVFLASKVFRLELSMD